MAPGTDDEGRDDERARRHPGERPGRRGIGSVEGVGNDMAQAREVVPVMDAKATKRTKATANGAQTRKGLGGPYGASFTGVGTRGLTFERRWTRPGVHPYDEIQWELRTAGISSETRSTTRGYAMSGASSDEA